MDLSVLQYYITVCETHSITKAADKLYISRQAVSKSIKNLEDSLDTQLIKKSRGGIKLTDEGVCLYRNALKLLDIRDSTVREIESIKRAHSRTLRVGYGQMTYNLWDSNHINYFMEQNKNINVVAEVMLPDQLIAGLKSNRLDMVVTSADSNEKCFSVSTIKSMPLYALMVANDELASKKYIYPKDLFGRNIYFIPNNQFFFKAFNELLNAEKIRANCQYCIDSNLITILNEISKNHGLFFTSGIFRNHFLHQDEYIFKSFICENSDITINKDIRAITMKQSSQTDMAKCYTGYLKDTIRVKGVMNGI